MNEWIVRFDKEQGEDVAVGELIRCKDCRWYKTDYSYKYRFCEFGHDIFRKADDFCSRAERKEE